VRSVVVIGGGIAGLTAASELTEAGVEVTLVEAADSMGGRMRTVRVAGIPVDVGAAFFADFYPQAMRLLDRCGLRSELSPFPLAAGVEQDGHITPVWPAAVFLRGRLLPPLALLRLAAGWVRLAPGWHALDPSNLMSAIRYDTRTVDSWAHEVLGDRAAALLIEPVLRGVLHWEMATTSQAVLFAMMKAVGGYRGAYRLNDGMVSLCERLGVQFDVRCGTRVTSASREGDRWVVHVEGPGASGPLRAGGLVCATTASAVPRLLPGLTGRQRAFFAGIHYSATAVAVVRAPARTDHRSTSVLFTKAREPDLVGVTVTGRDAADGRETVKISLSDSAYRATADLPDEQLGVRILQLARRNPALSSWLADATVHEVVRWPEALPRFDVGQLRRIQRWRAGEQPPGLAFAGDYLAGPYLEGAVRSGFEAAADLLADQQRPTPDR
jgi:protoporphyrinogen/coproporphyrinogen III oxidase